MPGQLQVCVRVRLRVCGRCRLRLAVGFTALVKSIAGAAHSRYTFWAATAAWKKFQVDGNVSFVIDLLPGVCGSRRCLRVCARSCAWTTTVAPTPICAFIVAVGECTAVNVWHCVADLVNNLYGWEASHSVPFGIAASNAIISGASSTSTSSSSGSCFFQSDGADGGEVSIGGSGCRPTINSAMASEARAVAAIAELLPGSAVVPGVAPPPRPVPPRPPSPGKLVSNDTFCCNTACVAGHSTFVFEGADADCAQRCLSYPEDVGRFYTQ